MSGGRSLSRKDLPPPPPPPPPQNRTDGSAPYTLIINIPYRLLTDSDMTTTLADLGFVPGANLILKPASTVSDAYSGTSVTRPAFQQAASAGLGGIFSNLLAAASFYMTAFWSTIFPQNRGADPEEGGRHPAPQTSMSPASFGNPSPAPATSSSPTPRPAAQGRIRQLGDLSDSSSSPKKDDNQGFYNGNSLTFDG